MFFDIIILVKLRTNIFGLILFTKTFVIMLLYNVTFKIKK